jgi:hypothetical protein
VKKSAKRLYNWSGPAALLLLPLLIFIATVMWILRVLFGMGACISTQVSSISVAGLRFQVEDLNCDTIAKDESVSVYGFADRGRGRTLLFKYDPGSYPLPPTTIQVPDPQTIVIAVPSVSSVFFQLDSWNNHSIRYNIGHVYYPRLDGKPTE